MAVFLTVTAVNNTRTCRTKMHTIYY